MLHRALLVAVICVTAAAQASFAAGLSRRALDRLAGEARELLARKMEALNSEEAGQRHEQGVHRESSAPQSSGCPFAGGQLWSESSVESVARSAKVAAIYEETTRELLARLGDSDEGVRKAALAYVNRRLKRGTGDSCSGVCPVQATAACDPDKPYREPDGSCNNLDHPGWGKAYACETRLLDADYGDGVSAPRVARHGGPLPSARLVSYKVHPEKHRPDRRLTHLSMAFGQFIDHDVAFAPPSTLPSLETFLGIQNGLLNGTEPFDMELPEDDPFYSKFGKTSLPFLRSLPCCHCQLGPRKQMNSRTSFIDASQMYGIRNDIMDTLRRFSGGLLEYQTVKGSDLPPPSYEPNNDTCSSPEEGKICFRSGDFRVNQNIGLMTLHTLFLREHNRIARKLSAINTHWDDERIFQVTKRIVESRYQNVVFNEWLPEIIGPEATKRFGLRPKRWGYTKYNPRLNPTMVNEFSAAAYRFGHADIEGDFKLIERDGKEVGVIDLKDNYFQQFNFYEGPIEDTALRGFITQPMQATGRYGETAVTHFLFRKPGQKTGADLFATDMQRGRDHGTRPYTDYVKLCRNVTIETFHDLHRKKLMPARIAKLYSNIYWDVRDIDLFSAGLNEPVVKDAAMGPTFLCIVAEMFRRLKYGDRFYFEHGHQAGSFTPEQLATLRETTLAKIICENTGIDMKIQRNVFRLPSREPKVDCQDLPDIRLDLWADPC